MKKLIAVIASLTIMVSVLTGCSGNEAKELSVESAHAWDNITLASWGDTKVTMTDFMYFLRSTQASYEQNAIANGEFTADNVNEYWTNNSTGKENSDEVKKLSIGDARHFETLYKMAVDAGTRLDADIESESRDAVQNAALALSEDPDEAALLFLEQYGVTVEQMIGIYNKMDMINNYLYDMSDISLVSDEEALAEYEADPDKFDLVTVRHVLILCDDSMSSEDQEAAKVKAEEILNKLNSGEDIGTLAAEYSEDPGSKDNNGEYTFGRNEMVQEFEAWAYSAQTGETGMVKTSYGYHVMQMIKHLEYKDVIDEVKAVIGNGNAENIIQEALVTADNEWQTDQKAIDKVKI